MSLLKIARMGHPVLRQAAESVADPGHPEIRRLAADMVETMLDAPGVGLAAPQVHIPLRMIVFRAPVELPEGSPEPEEKAEEIIQLINPVIEPVGDEILLGLEGCLSIPELRGYVPRYKTIRYRGVTPDGAPIDRIAQYFHARVVQHEVDHLDGILYLDRMPDLRLLTYPENLAHITDEKKARNRDE